MRGLIRIILVFVAVSIVISIIRGLFASQAQRKAPTSKRSRYTPRPKTSGKLVKDPVCGTYVAEESAIHAKDFFFCSEECRRKFLETM